MIKIRPISIIIPLVVLSLNAGAQSPSYQKGERLYVLSAAGLNLRDKPSKEGKAITLVPYGATITFIQGTGSTAIIENIKGSWIEADYRGIKGFIFDGYLTRVTPPKPAISIKDFANTSFEKNGKEASATNESVAETIQRYKNGGALTIKDGGFYATWELTIPAIRIEEGFLLLSLLAHPVFRNDPFPAGTKEYREKIGSEEWSVSVTVDRKQNGNITKINILKGCEGISRSIEVSVDKQGMVRLFHSTAH